jgi:general secretion pathway protein L
MADWLLIRLGHDAHAEASWLVADASGRMVMPVQRGALADAAFLAGSRRVCVLVPAPDVLLTEADVPVRAGAKAREIVPFALEEHLAEDVESLHFAVGKRGPDSARTPVAVVSRSLMDGWFAALAEARLTAEAVYAESDLLPINPGQAVALLDGDSAVVRLTGSPPATMPIDALGEALELVRPPPADTGAVPERTGSGLVLYAGTAEWQQRSDEVEALRDRFDGIKVQLLSDGPLALYALQLPGIAATGINLLQGPYAPVSSLASRLKAWRVAAALLGGLIVLHAAGSATELMSLKKAERRLDASITETFRQAMHEQNATDARHRMEQRLVGAGDGADGGLLPTLQALAQFRGAARDTTIQALSFREGALELRVSAPSADTLDHLSETLRNNGWQANLTSGTPGKSGYEGRIEIKAKR